MQINLGAVLAQLGASPVAKPRPTPVSGSAGGQAVPAPSAAELGAAVDRLNASAQSMGRSLSFQLDEVTGQTVITVTDSNDGQIIRQIPSVEALTLAARMEEIQGKLFDQRV